MMGQNELGSNSLTELLDACYKKARAYDELMKLITDNGLCIGSEYAGDLTAMVNHLIREAKKPNPRRILEAERSFDELGAACQLLLAYRRNAGATRFQLEKADHYLHEIEVLLDADSYESGLGGA